MRTLACSSHMHTDIYVDKGTTCPLHNMLGSHISPDTQGMCNTRSTFPNVSMSVPKPKVTVLQREKAVNQHLPSYSKTVFFPYAWRPLGCRGDKEALR